MSFSFMNAQEKIELCIIQGKELANIVDNSQMALELARVKHQDEEQRGIVGEAINFAANVATRAITSIIDNAQSSRTVEWTAPTTKDYFYNTVSYLGPLDPSGLQFSGFTMRRQYCEDGKEDDGKSAMFLKCSIPSENMSNFITNSRFTMKVDTLAIDLSKVRAKYTSKKKISVEITVRMFSTWLDRDLTIHQDQQLGEFKICLRNLKYDPERPLKTYNSEEAKNFITGFCFFIPRSYGAYTVSDSYNECWSQGEFSIIVSVKESTAKKVSKSKTSQYALEYFQSALPTTLKNIASNKEIMGPKVVEIISKY